MNNTTTEMSLESAMTFVINDEPCDGQNRLWFSNKDAADTFSESKKEDWASGIGQVFGPFTNSKITKWYEVSY